MAMRMEVLRSYTCDDGHRWAVRRLHGEEERPEDAVCPDGHEAVTCHEEEPADEVQILFRPAALIAPGQRTDPRYKGRYWLLLLDRTGAELCRSSQTYTWEQVVALSQLFRGKSVEQAQLWWARRNP